jgi:hypothetical protein
MPFVGWDPLVRDCFFGAVFLIPLFAVLWVWYDSTGRTGGARWVWRLLLTLVVLATTPAVALGAANLDTTQQDLLRVFGWLAIGSGGVVLVGTLAYAIWGRSPIADLVEATGVIDHEFDQGAAIGVPQYPDPDEAFDMATIAAPPTVAAPPTLSPPAMATTVLSPANSERPGAYLFVKRGPDQGQRFAVGNQVTIGRGARCNVVLADPRVSTEHGQLKREEASYTYLDLKSTNGSFLVVEGREERLRASQTLVDGDELRLGQTVLKFIRVAEGAGR